MSTLPQDITESPYPVLTDTKRQPSTCVCQKKREPGQIKERDTCMKAENQLWKDDFRFFFLYSVSRGRDFRFGTSLVSLSSCAIASYRLSLL
ncbi:hypothetical protein NPIL_628001 [Nephila pilipes]|uniref:Uncharacterized protein n=1 Tax=Nephila pilipes TaxID=299642 RepID=A0A8X6NLQ4_NEPPI|nr:hypothetical protein NPIL_628001 [Nephila pilipes]